VRRDGEMRKLAPSPASGRRGRKGEARSRPAEQDSDARHGQRRDRLGHLRAQGGETFMREAMWRRQRGDDIFAAPGVMFGQPDQVGGTVHAWVHEGDGKGPSGRAASDGSQIRGGQPSGGKGIVRPFAVRVGHNRFGVRRCGAARGQPAQQPRRCHLDDPCLQPHRRRDACRHGKMPRLAVGEYPGSATATYRLRHCRTLHNFVA